MGALANITNFVREAKAEGKKVTWPTRKRIISATGVILFIVMLLTIYISFTDIVLSRMMVIITNLS